MTQSDIFIMSYSDCHARDVMQRYIIEAGNLVNLSK